MFVTESDVDTNTVVDVFAVKKVAVAQMFEYLNTKLVIKMFPLIYHCMSIDHVGTTLNHSDAGMCVYTSEKFIDSVLNAAGLEDCNMSTGDSDDYPCFTSYGHALAVTVSPGER